MYKIELILYIWAKMASFQVETKLTRSYATLGVKFHQEIRRIDAANAGRKGRLFGLMSYDFPVPLFSHGSLQPGYPSRRWSIIDERLRALGVRSRFNGRM